MNKFFTTFLLLLCGGILMAGNPDRKGAAGAGELLMNPWARSAGLHTIFTSGISGIEATRLNIAGLARINKTEIAFGHMQYLVGTDIAVNSLGIAQKVGKRGVFGLDIMVFDFGDIRVTTTDQPEGTGAYYSPTWANLAVSYATTFENKVSVGLSARFIMESITDIRASGIAIDAGVQYVNGVKDNFKLGLSLRNLGTPMKFNGEGFTTLKSTASNYNLAYDQRSANYELPVTLNIGTSYDFYFGDEIRFTPIANFTSNSFSQDQLGLGAEVSVFDDIVQVRGAYKFDLQTASVEERDVYTGLALGASANLFLNKETGAKIGFDYAYRTTRAFSGSHNFGIRLNFGK